ncbi:hypothetical protein F1559_004161 [Cyanidiococcus yangmingshanensis]|uniref:Uncharacterized protein n=1 Tax=Cyanidiococcus yangmingshanensis TaxID=2690220 RepID=A0A7J7IRE2_9RHOD|nr:hypothetical protein F1559_004161 [Cyanidiococcus yangmingshanensis]
MATKVESEQVAEKLDSVLITWERLLESGAFELAQKETTALRRLISASVPPKTVEKTPELETNAVWLRHQATLWYRWVPVLCRAVRSEQAGSCSLLCFLFEDARRFLFPLCGLAKPVRHPKPGRLPGSSITAVRPSWPTFVPVSERYRMHLGLVYDTLGTALGVVHTPESLDVVTITGGKGVVDHSTWVCQLMRCLGVVVQNTPSRCLPTEQLGTLQQLIWKQYALSVGREVETLRAAALSCLKTIHTRLGTFPSLSLLLEDHERWNDTHVVSFVEAMLALRTHLRESRHQHDREDVQSDELVMQMIHHHLGCSSTSSTLRLQSARLLRQMLRLHPQLGETQQALTLNLLRDSFHAVRVVAVDCLTQRDTGLDTQMMFVEFQTLTRDPTAAMRAAACTALGRIPLADSVTEAMLVNSADASTPTIDTDLSADS